MIKKLVDTTFKLFSVLSLYLIVDYFATDFYEMHIKNGVRVFTIVFIENVLSFLTCLFVILFFPSIRKDVFSGILKINKLDKIKFFIYSNLILLLLGLTYSALIHNNASTITVLQVISGIIFGGIIYFLTTKDTIDFRKILACIVMSAASLIYNLL